MKAPFDKLKNQKGIGKKRVDVAPQVEMSPISLHEQRLLPRRRGGDFRKEKVLKKKRPNRTIEVLHKRRLPREEPFAVTEKGTDGGSLLLGNVLSGSRHD